MNKKAEFFMAEVLKIVLAVISIGLLIYLLVSLYGIFIGKTRLAQARETLEQIIVKIEGMEEGDVEEFLIVAPKKAFFVYFDKENSGGRCSGENCLCICLDSTDKKTCGITDGVCQEIKFNVKMEKIGVQGMNEQTDWYMINAPTQITLERGESDIFIKTSLEVVPELKPDKEKIERSKLSDNLLRETINYEGKDILFEDFVKTNLLGECNFNSKEDVEKEIRDEVEKFSLKYINEIKETEIVDGRVAVVYAYGLKRFVDPHAKNKKLASVEIYNPFYVEDGDVEKFLDYPTNLNADYLNFDSKDLISRKLICENEKRAYFVFVLEEKNE